MTGSAIGGLFLRRDETLVELAEQAYSVEDELQVLLADFPELLPGAQIDPDDPRRSCSSDEKLLWEG